MSPNRKRRTWLSWARNLLLIATLIAAVQWWQTRDLPKGHAPSLSGALLDGRSVDLEDYRGRPVLVHFWATWCPVCRAEQGTIQRLAEDFPILTVATSSGKAPQIRNYLNEQMLDFPVLPDERGELARQWQVGGVPASFVIDPRGNIASTTMGYTTGLGLRLRLWLASD
jgi:peroxiredoxin